MAADVIVAVLSTPNTAGKTGITRNQGVRQWCKHEGIEASGIRTSPESVLARKLLLAGYPPDAPFRTVWDHGTPSMEWPSLRDAGRKDVYDDDKTGLIKRKWMVNEAHWRSPEQIEDDVKVYTIIHGVPPILKRTSGKEQGRINAAISQE